MLAKADIIILGLHTQKWRRSQESENVTCISLSD